MKNEIKIRKENEKNEIKIRTKVKGKVCGRGVRGKKRGREERRTAEITKIEKTGAEEQNLWEEGKEDTYSLLHIFRGRIPFMGYTASRARRLNVGGRRRRL